MSFPIPSRYKIVKMGPVGGQASIVYAKDEWLNRDVVMKAALPNAPYEAAQEVRSLAAVNSKHVVAIYDAIWDQGKIVAVVEESVEGELLSRKFPATTPLKTKLHLLYQIACGVADMHKIGCVHRDLTPNNMKVRSDGLLKIFDLGITTILEDGDTTQIGKGTRGYKAPELDLPGRKTVTNKADIYSLGVIAHQMLSDGRLAPQFTSSRPADPTAGGVTFDEFQQVGKHLKRIFNECISSAPDMRPSIKAVCEAIIAEILRDQHEAKIAVRTGTFTLNAQNKAVKIDDQSGNYVVIRYTGTRFKIDSFSGAVYVNNVPVEAGQVLQGAMVITLGLSSQGSSRLFATFDISNPEISV
jgi:serine/threonine-protein kinase